MLRPTFKEPDYDPGTAPSAREYNQRGGFYSWVNWRHHEIPNNYL